MIKRLQRFGVFEQRKRIVNLLVPEEHWLYGRQAPGSRADRRLEKAASPSPWKCAPSQVHQKQTFLARAVGVFTHELPKLKKRVSWVFF